MSKRDNSIDFLRVLSMFAIIVLHVSSLWLNNKNLSPNGLMYAYIYDGLTRFAVPCFIMISGAMILKNLSYNNVKAFYSKSVRKIIKPTILFSVLYTLYNFILYLLSTQFGIEFSLTPLEILSNFILGKPMYHLWYMYMLIVVYALSPLLILLKTNTTEKQYKIIFTIFLLISVFSNWLAEEPRAQWDMGRAFEYLSYFAVGDLLYQRKFQLTNFKKRITPFVLVLVGFLLCVLCSLLKYKYSDASFYDFKVSFTSPFNPIIVVASIFVFFGITSISFPKSKMIRSISDLSFTVYLVHALVIDIISKALFFAVGKTEFFRLSATLFIPFFSLFVLASSIVMAVIYERFLSILRKKSISI